MHVPQLLQQRFMDALSEFTDQADQYAAMIRATSDPKHGDYQANCAMPLAKHLNDGRNPREVASMLVARLELDDLCEPPEIAGPGFINLKLKESFLTTTLQQILGDERCGITQVKTDKSIVIDFSSPNVAKPMHVGHIRSTVIGDSLARTLGFLGYPIVTDNHLGDWGTQFGIIIYGYKHFGDEATVAADPVTELAKLYRIVNQLVEYQKAIKSLPRLRQAIEDAKQAVSLARIDAENADSKQQKKAKKAVSATERRLLGAEANLASAEEKISNIDQDPDLGPRAKEHDSIDTDVLEETAKLHRGDEVNLSLWNRFLPHCKDEINRMYNRLDIHFDHTLGESFYHPMLAKVTSKLEQLGLASDSDGALCVFLPEFDAPMIVRKQDGAYLYATTDLATLEYRLNEFNPAEILYVVDTRQSEHFDKLFAVADHFGLKDVKLVHVNFGTVLGEDGRPMKTRSGSLIGLESLLNDAVERAKEVVCNPERLSGFTPPMETEEQQHIAEVIGIGAIKFADLSHHRTSDYRFNLDKMVALEGNTSAYVQYSYARMQKILQNANVNDEDVAALVREHGLEFTHIAERNLVLQLLKFEEALHNVHKDYAPNHLVDYLLDTAKAYSRFNDNCHVIKAESEAIRSTRLAIVVQCKQTLAKGLNLLGIDVVSRM